MNFLNVNYVPDYCIFLHFISLSTDDFDLTLDNLDESNSHLVVALGEFNIKSSNWYINAKTTRADAKIEFVTSQYVFHQIINEPIDILENSSFYVDHIFTSQPNLVVDSDVHPSLHPTVIIKLCMQSLT